MFFSRSCKESKKTLFFYDCKVIYYKIRVFGNVLRAIEKRYSPDLILVACNTLSVLLPDTPAARSARRRGRGPAAAAG